MSRSVVIADSSCLIALDNIGELELLPKLFTKIFITLEVSTEYGKPLPKWIEIRTGSRANNQIEKLKILDAGEASSIALALDSTDSLLIIDEKKGRRIAEEMGIEIIGTVGIILEANAAGLIELSGTIVERLESANFRISKALRSKLINPDRRV